MVILLRVTMGDDPSDGDDAAALRI
jgi:hypothetical protein